MVPMELADLVSSASPIVGNVFGMIPRSMHASLLRNSLSVLSVTYTICLVDCSSPLLFFPDNLSIVAPRMRMLLVFAACISMSTGMRSLTERPSFLTTLRSAKQLWQPVSAIALTKDRACGALRGNPKWL